MITGTIFDIKHFALHDGPGTRTTIFLKGCPLCCQWCHNPEGISTSPKLIYHENRCIHCGRCVEVCPSGAILFQNGKLTRMEGCDLCMECVSVCPPGAWEITGETISAETVIARVEKDIVFFDESLGGITFSGGEPLSQIDFLEELLKLAKTRRIHTAVDTSGFAPFDSFTRILPYTDLFLFDIKCLDEEVHKRFTGVSNRIILDNFLKLTGHTREIYIRIPIIPGFNDSKKEIASIGQFVLQNSPIRRIDLLPYHHMAQAKYERLGEAYLLENAPVIDPLFIQEIRHGLEQQGFKITIGG